ncbi:noncanonical pyrimidine nucleotidase, YjjG family [Halobacteriovorax marinus]|uniref:Noncanonical pyrimidine nucleotidase, YjjG family n=1 Tax=Halobacteriovorax marinus TaxID=97084 RepID=A0A1Y5FAG7_9BACT|nr:noncanonical pyrimidine nucleotidase, YjjG family [Halobacteriovorax marinus]
MKKYKSLFIDLDNTLLRFSETEVFAFDKLMELHSLNHPDSFKIYKRCNKALWDKVELGETTPQELKIQRFVDFSKEINLKVEAQLLSDQYEDFLGEGIFPLEGAFELIKDLAKEYELICTTNGLSIVQHKRLKKSKLVESFTHVIVSEEEGFSKPDKRFFSVALSKSMTSDPSEVLVIGDSLSADIVGGINAGHDTCWLNEAKASSGEVGPTFTVSTLAEIGKILLDSN